MASNGPPGWSLGGYQISLWRSAARETRAGFNVKRGADVLGSDRSSGVSDRTYTAWSRIYLLRAK